MKKLKTNKSYGVMFSVLLVMLSCSNKNDRPFFPAMKEGYGEIPLDSSSVYLSWFGLSENEITVNANRYWKLNCRDGFFSLSGYLRPKDDSIMLLPIDGVGDAATKEMKVLDFGASAGATWTVMLDTKGGILRGDSIVYLGSDINGDTVYRFGVYPFNFFPKNASRAYQDHSFKVAVRKRNDFESITGMDRSDTVIYCRLHPETKLIDKRNGALRL